jgi:hypothetical protein
MKPETYGEAEYIADNYGSCALEKCLCLAPRVPWLGRGARTGARRPLVH